MIATLDARMREIYWATYEYADGHWCERVAPTVVAPDDVVLPPGPGWSGVGNGFAAYPALRQRLATVLATCSEDITPTATAIGTLALPRLEAGLGVPARDATPLYVRHRVALTDAERAAGKPL